MSTLLSVNSKDPTFFISGYSYHFTKSTLHISYEIFNHLLLHCSVYKILCFLHVTMFKIITE